MKLLRKITIKTCGDFTVHRIKELLGKSGPEVDGKPGPVPEGGEVQLLKVAGMATSASTGQTDKGQFTRLSGQFIGTDLTTGELYQSGQCILPEYIGSQLGTALLSMDGKAVQFAFQIAAKRKDSALTGYEYTVQPLIESRPTDAMQELMKIAGIVDNAPAKLPAAPPAPAIKEAKKEAPKK